MPTDIGISCRRTDRYAAEAFDHEIRKEKTDLGRTRREDASTASISLVPQSSPVPTDIRRRRCRRSD
jgi:hypothetical protein